MNTYDKALAMLERDGWTQNQARTPDGRRCMGQAIYSAYLGSDTAMNQADSNDAMAAMTFVTEKILGGRPLVDWNDNPRRTYDEVVAALKAASVAWDAEQAEKPTLEFKLTIPQQLAIAEEQLAKLDKAIADAMHGAGLVNA